MEPKEKKAFEPSGLVPRSIVRTFERFRQQLLPGSETAAIREYRISRYQVLVSARCLFTLLTIPIVTNWLVSSWILSPLIEHFWNTQQNEIFLNSYQEEHAFAELEFFSEKIFFESLLNKMGTLTIPTRLSIWESSYMPEYTPKGTPLYLVSYVPGMLADPSACEAADSYPRGEAQLRSRQPKYGSQVIPLKSTSTSDFRLRHPTFGLRNREERSEAALPASFSTELATYAYPSGKQGEGVQLPFGYAKQPVLLPLYPLGLTDPKGMQRGKVCRQAPDAPIPICFASPTGYRACEAEGQGMQHFSAVEKRRRSQAEEKIIVTYEDNVKDNGYSYNDPTSMLRFSFAPMLRRPLFSPNYGCFLLCKPVGAKQETLTQSVYKKVRVYSLAILQADNNQEQANENLGIRRTSCCILYPEGASYYPSPLYPLAKRGASYDPFGVRYAEGMGASEAGYACSASLSSDAEGHPTFEYPRFAKGQKAYPSGTEGMQAEVASSGGSGTDGYAREVLLSFLLRQPKENCYVPFCLASSSGCFAYIPEGLVSIPNPEGVVGCRRSTRINSIDAKFVQNNSSGTLILSEAQKLTVPGSFVDTYGLQNGALLDQKPQTNSLELEIDSVKIKEKVQEKILELAIYYNQQTILSITNIVGDLVSIFTLGCLFIWMKPEIAILKSFLIEAIYSLSDTTKSFLLILLTDLLVGFHSPRGWETALELLLKHFGLPENQDFVFLFVATFPVLLDTVFKYWIFRHLNKISPSTVATYHSMIE